VDLHFAFAVQIERKLAFYVLYVMHKSQVYMCRSWKRQYKYSVIFILFFSLKQFNRVEGWISLSIEKNCQKIYLKNNNFRFFQVSWLRGRDTSVLSVGHLTFSSSERFRVVSTPNPTLNVVDWNLEVSSKFYNAFELWKLKVAKSIFKTFKLAVIWK